jgi:hypothetical protein
MATATSPADGALPDRYVLEFDGPVARLSVREE